MVRSFTSSRDGGRQREIAGRPQQQIFSWSGQNEKLVTKTFLNNTQTFPEKHEELDYLNVTDKTQLF